MLLSFLQLVSHTFSSFTRCPCHSHWCEKSSSYYCPLAVMILANHHTAFTIPRHMNQKEKLLQMGTFLTLICHFSLCLMTGVIIRTCKWMFQSFFSLHIVKFPLLVWTLEPTCPWLLSVSFHKETVLQLWSALLRPELSVCLYGCINLNCLHYTVCQCVYTTGAKWSDRRLDCLLFPWAHNIWWRNWQLQFLLFKTFRHCTAVYSNYMFEEKLTVYILLLDVGL